MTRDERLIAYVDGELDPAEQARFEAEIAGDPDLARAVERHRQLVSRVSAAYAPVLKEDVPPQLLAVAAVANDRAPRRAVRLAPWAAAAAASLAIGVLAGHALWPASGPVAVADGGLAARGDIARALSRGLAADQGPVKVGLTLKTADGHYCRTFQSGPDRLAGLACHQGDGWRIRTLAAWTPAPAGSYRQAASDTPPEVLAAVDALAAEPLDAAAERTARDHGWR